MKFGTSVLNANMHRLTKSVFLVWRHNFKMMAMKSFHADKCCHLVSMWICLVNADTTSAACLYSSPCQFLIYTVSEATCKLDSVISGWKLLNHYQITGELHYVIIMRVVP